MDELEIATLKDNILKYLQNLSSMGADLDTIKKDLSIFTLPKGIVKACAEEMDRDQVITFHAVEGDDGFLVKTDKGHKFLVAGGYTKPLQERLNERRQQEEDNLRARKKTDLEIKNLKWGWWFSIAAIIISIAALVVSILI
jgi:hypothetical protein